MRKRFKAARIASSDNYELSRRIHSQYLKRWHNANIEVITEITTSLVIKEQKIHKSIWRINSDFGRGIENP